MANVFDGRTNTVPALPLQQQMSEWKPEIRMPSNSDYVILSGLQWDTEYDVVVVAENEKGKSQAATVSLRTAPKPEAIPGRFRRPRPPA